MNDKGPGEDGTQFGVAEKVRFLRQPAAYATAPDAVTVKETHMSWVFLAGERVYKLKKPVRTPYLDFSTLARREAACRAEFHLNRRLAPDVYLGVVALTAGERGPAIGGPGAVVDWLVVTRRLEARRFLDDALAKRRVTPADLDRVVRVLLRFYRRAVRVSITPQAYIRSFHRTLADNRRILLNPDLGVPARQVMRLDRAQRAFLSARRRLVAERARTRAIVDGHGDLRPEHVWIGTPVRVIDCLEFNPALRAVDPFDEVAFLDLECRRLGAPWAGKHLRRAFANGFGAAPPDGLYLFYRCHRATLRARLALAHLLDPDPRTPEKWLPQSRAYLALAEDDARRLGKFVNTRRGR